MLALGEIGLSYDYFYSLTPRVFYNIVEGYRMKEEKNIRCSWEQTRCLFYAALKPHLKGNKTAEQLMPFPWDNKDNDHDDQQITTAEEAEAVLQKQKEYWDAIQVKKGEKLQINQNGKFITD